MPVDRLSLWSPLRCLRRLSVLDLGLFENLRWGFPSVDFGLSFYYSSFGFSIRLFGHLMDLVLGYFH